MATFVNATQTQIKCKQYEFTQKGTNTMFKLILLVLALVGGYVVLQTLPDLQRYLRIRAM